MTPNQIKSIRDRLGLSKLQLAKLCGVSPRTVEGWEQGRQPSGPALQILQKIALATGTEKRRNLIGRNQSKP